MTNREAVMTEYRVAREAYVVAREVAAHGYAAESREYDETHRAVTLRSWLVAFRQEVEHVEPLTADELAALASVQGW